jgi:hypothetical protein
MATGEPQPARTRNLQEWADTIAVGGLVLAGLLVSVCAPILRRRNETLRGELDEAVLQLGAALDDERQAPGPDDGQAAEPGAAPMPHLAAELNHQAAAELGADAP